MRFTFILHVGVLALIRSWRATVVLMLMVLCAVAVLVFVSALGVGTNDAMVRNSTGMFTGHIAGSGVMEQVDELQQVPGVSKVLLRRHMVVVLSSGDTSEPVNLVGINPDLERETTALFRKTVDGEFPSSGSDSIYLSSDTAKQLHVKIGDRVAVNSPEGATITKLLLAGIYDTGLSRLDIGMAFCPAKAINVGWQGNSVAIFLTNQSGLNQITAQLKHLQPSAKFMSWPEFMPDLKQLIDLDNVCMGIVIILVFSIVAVGISCIFLIFTLKNLREYGIMKAMGMRSQDTAMLLMTQIGLLTLAAAIIGGLAGFLLVTAFGQSGIDIGRFTSHNQYFAVSGMLYPRLTVSALFAPPVAAVVSGLFASIWPIMYMIRRDPAEILRSL